MSSLPPAGAPGPGEALVRVVVIAWNSADVLGGFLASLTSASQGSPEVVIVDNAAPAAPPAPTSTPVPAPVAGSPLAVAAKVLAPGVNLGYGGGANLGAAGATAPWLLIANPDLTFAPGALDALLAAAERWPGAGVLGPGILTPDGQLYPSARQLPSLVRGVGHAVLGWWWPGNPFTRSYRREGGPAQEGPAGWLSGSCLLVRREVFEAVGGFDTSFFMYCEDMDLCERIAAAGHQVVYAPSAVVTHQGGHATAQHSRAMLRAHHDSMALYLSRRYPRGAPLLRLALRVRYLASLVVAGIGAGARPTRGAEALHRAAPPAR